MNLHVILHTFVSIIVSIGRLRVGLWQRTCAGEFFLKRLSDLRSGDGNERALALC